MAKPNNRQVALLFDRAAAGYDEKSNPYAVRRRVEALAAHVRGRSLEVGGGTGAVTAALADRSRAIHSDISPQMCRTARRRLGCPSVCLDGEAIPLADESIDTAIGCEMIYYLDHPERFVAEIHRVLRPGGKLLISATNPTMTILERARTVLRKLSFKRMFFDDGSPPFIPLAHLIRMLEGGGFTVESTRKIVVLPVGFLDAVNRALERSALRHFGLFMVLVAGKRAPGPG